MYPARALLLLLFLATCRAVVAQPLTRVAATSLRLTGTPPPTTYSTARAFAPLSFNYPVALVTPPGDSNRLFVVERSGRIWIIPDVTAASPTRTLFLDLSTRVATSSDANDERGLLALAFHPNHAVNREFFVWYTLNATTAAGSGLHDRLSRFRTSAGNASAADANSEQPLITQRDEAGNHNGGDLHFGPDGYLYLSSGDEGAGDDALQNSRRIDRDFFAAILRLDVDRRPGSLAPNTHPAVHAGTYAIPPDNPFIGASFFSGAAVNPSTVRTEFWAVGLRNPWRFSFDSATGRLWAGDVGQNAREEIDVIVRGGNYGWNYREGNLLRATPPAGTNHVAPVWDYPHSQGQSVTGGLVYRGSRYPALAGHYLFADFVSGRIWSLEPDGDNPVSAERVQLLATDGGISSFGLNPANGDILLADLLDGTIKRLVATGGGGPTYPATLSATGAFSALATLTPAAGLVAYEPNVSFWSDHARKRRWFALPDTISTFGFAVDGAWSLPPGATWVKHFDLELERGNPATARRIETRFLVRTADGVYGLSYRWNAAQTDATLVPDEGADQAFTVSENGIAQTQTWRFPGRAECVACHTPAGGHALSFNTRQLNRTQSFPGGAANIIAALAGAGYLSSPPPPATTLPALAAADNVSVSLEGRVRAYLDVNCAQCHQPGGGAPGLWDARALTPLSFAGIVDGPLLDTGADPANRVVVPGVPAHSRLLQLSARRGAGQMPPLASNARDLAGEALLSAWISSLSATPPPSRLVNLASRVHVDAGGSGVLPGFVIGPGSNKTVLIRAVGPRLADFGVPNSLPQPVLTLRRDTQSIATNTRWGTAANAADIASTALRVGAFSLAAGGFDSAIVATLAPGLYTAQVTGANNTSGVALVEVYNADPATSPAPARLVNLAVRAVAGGSDVLTAGLVVSDGAPARLLVRAVGPGLRQFNVAGFHPAPVLTLFSGTQSLFSNAGWITSPSAADIRAAADLTGAFALEEGSRDSALLASFSPGAYTIQVTGAPGVTGEVLIEVYELP